MTASVATRPTRPSRAKLQDNPAFLALLAAAAAGKIERRYRIGLGMHDVIRSPEGWRNVTDEVAMMRRERWLEGPLRTANPAGGGADLLLWRPSSVGWRVLARRRLIVRTGEDQPPVDERIIPILPTAPRTNHMIYRAAVYLETAAAVARSRQLKPGCSPDGVRRTCFACVYCVIAAARADYSRVVRSVCEADSADSMIIAFEAAEADHLHLNPPADTIVTADLLMAAAGDLHHRAVPSRVLIARTA